MNATQTAKLVKRLRSHDPSVGKLVYYLAEDNVKLLGEVHSLRRKLDELQRLS